VSDIRLARTLPKVYVSLPKQAHDPLCTVSLLHQRTLSNPTRGTRILSHDLDQELRRASLHDDRVNRAVKAAALPASGRSDAEAEIA
jgi:hypothetical protein